MESNGITVFPKSNGIISTLWDKDCPVERADRRYVYLRPKNT